MSRPDHLSVSQINMWLRCPLQFMFRYDEGIKIPPGAVMTLSKSVHAGIESNYTQKIESHKDISQDEVLDHFNTSFNHLKHETLWLKYEKPGDFRNEGQGCSKAYYSEIATKTQPAQVETKFRVEFENFDRPLVGVIDLIDEPGTLRDTKTSGKAPSIMDKETQEAHQFTAYTLGYHQTYKKLPSKIQCDVIFRSTKTLKPRTKSFPTSRTPQQISRFLKTMAMVNKAIEAKAYYPCAPSWICTPRWCGFFDLCHKEF